MPLRRITFSGRYLSQEEKETDRRKILVNGGIYAAIDIGISLAVGLFIYETFKGYLIIPIERGFYCDDESIKFPKKPNSVPTKMLLAISFSTAPVIIVLAESFLFRASTGANLFSKWILSITIEYLHFILGLTMCISVMEIFKCACGRLRPYFLQECKPDWTKIDCITDPHAFIPDALCTGDHHEIKNARTSFPSGHGAAASFYSFYFVIYLWQICRLSTSAFMRMLAVVLTVVLLAWDAYVLFTRVDDNRHHIGDVVGGCLVGLLSAILTRSYPWSQTQYEYRDVNRNIKFE